MIASTTALGDAWIDPRVWETHPDYVALLLTADGLGGRPEQARGDDALVAAENAAVGLLDGRAPEDLAEIAVWRAAFASFGVKQRVARSSVEALLRRCALGLPRIEPLTDIYNAVSVQHLCRSAGRTSTATTDRRAWSWPTAPRPSTPWPTATRQFITPTPARSSGGTTRV